MLERRAWGRALRLLSWVSVFAAFLFSSRAASAYPWMIRHEYQGCVPCHADPSGAGILTEYGRAQGDLILRMRYGAPPPEEASPTARFLWGVPLPEWLLLEGSLRNGSQITKTSTGFTPSFLQMEADMRSQITVGRFRAYGGLGYMYKGAKPTQVTQRDLHNLVSREHWLGLDLGEDKQFLLRAGRIPIPFGIRTNEHDLFVRSTAITRTNFNESQQHGVSLSYNGAMTRGEIMALLGNYQLGSDKFRERGYSGFLELSLAPWAAAGLSSKLTYAKTDYLYGTTNTLRQAHGLFARLAPHEKVVIFAEADATIDMSEKTSAGGGTSPGVVGLLQADIEPVQGLHIIATGETWITGNTVLPSSTTPTTAKSFGGGGAIQWFFAPHADLRFDFLAFTLQNSSVSIYMLPQLHIYL